LAACEFVHLDFSAALCRDEFGKFFDPHAGRVIGVVQVAEFDRAFLNVLGQHCGVDGQEAENGGEFFQFRFHVISSGN
jgi:hypothetical protein